MSDTNEADFMGECMSSEDMALGYPDKRARAKVCTGRLCDTFGERIKAADVSHKHESEGFVERLTGSNFIDPKPEDYVDSTAGSNTKRYEYRDPKTGEVFYYERVGFYKKDGRTLVLVGSSEIRTGSAFRTPNGARDYSVYTISGNGEGEFLKVNKDNV